MNSEIQLETMHAVVDSGKGGKDDALGIMSQSEAMVKAWELGRLDLIMINPNSDPPVCKTVDYGKCRYQRERNVKEKKKKSKASETKEVKMSHEIDAHDYNVRVKAADKFMN